MNEPKEPTLDVARRILAELVEMTEHASLTRSLRGGEPAAAQAYNRVLATFVRNGIVPEGMFETASPDGAEYGILGVQCRLLMSAASPKKAKDEPRGDGGFGELIALAPFLDSEDLGRMVMERLGDGGTMPNGLLVGLAPFLDSGIMGQIIRRRAKAPTPSEPPAPPEPAQVAPAPPAPDLTPAFHADAAPESLESLVQTLKRPDLTPEDRTRIAMRLAELSYEQAVQG